MRMRNRVVALALGAAIAVSPGALLSKQADASVSVGISVFYDELAPYGDWVTVSSYGSCWRPRSVAVGWQPYLDGEWLYTDVGWTWASYDPWGGDPYHYGTWFWTIEYGWVWIPGDIWAPAWVTWYVGDAYIGWAPVPPSFVVTASGYAGPPVTVAQNAYVFVPTAQFAGVNASTARVPVTQNATLVSRARAVTRFAASGGVLATSGPAVAQVERVAGRKIQKTSLAAAKTTAAPLSTTLSGGKGAVIAPSADRTKLLTERSARREPGRIERRGEPARPAARPEAPRDELPPPAAREEPRDENPPPAVREPPRRDVPPHAVDQAPRNEGVPPGRVEGQRPSAPGPPARRPPPHKQPPRKEKPDG